MVTNRTSKKATPGDSQKRLAAQSLSEHKTITLVPAASSCSAFNYYANNDAEREAASARFRADVSSPTRKTKRR